MRTTGATRARQTIPDRRQQRPYERGPQALFYLQSASAALDGTATQDFTLDVTSAGIVTAMGLPKTVAGVSGLAFMLRITTIPTIPYVPVERPITEPSVSLQVAFQDTPLTQYPEWTEIGTRGRSLATQRGRSYEFDRMETGTLGAVLDNRDAALNPENAGVIRNVVLNPSLETNTTGWAANGAGTTITRWGGTDAAFGSFVLLIDSGGTTARGVYTVPDPYVPQGLRYTVSAYVKAQAGGTLGKSCQVLLWETGGASPAEATAVAYVDLTGDWQRVLAYGTIQKADRTGMEIYVGLSGNADAADYVDVDGVQLHWSDTTLGYVDGDQENCRWEGTAHASRSFLGGPYYPLISTRPFRAQLIWETVYPLFRGITEGYPQQYPSLGADALVQQQVNDLFYALNQARFPLGSTALAQSMTSTHTVMLVSSKSLLPEIYPWLAQIDSEKVNVTGTAGGNWYYVERGAESTTAAAHSAGATISTAVVSFAEEMSGARIRRVLEAVGFDSDWYDLDAGQTLIADSTDLASTSPLEHINLVVEAEFGRFFVSKAGKFTFRDRSSVILDYLDPVMTFSDGTLGQATDVPYVIEGALEHSEDKLYNRVKITTPSGFVADISDTDSIADHFERVFEREWPYANDNDATSAAHFVLMRSVEHSLRLPALSTAPARNPDVLWPIVLVREIGERCRFYYQPDAGNAIDKEVVIEGISHDIRPGEHRVRFQLTEADPNEYWILGLTGYGELGQTTWVGF